MQPANDAVPVDAVPVDATAADAATVDVLHVDVLRSLLWRVAGPLGLITDPAVPGAVDDGDVVVQIELIEQLKSALAARQARLTVALDTSQRARQRACGVPTRQVGRGVAEQVALARRESPTAGAEHLRCAKALVNEMPHTLAALGAGLVSEWTATVAVRETACLTPQDRTLVDAELAGDLPSMTPAQLRGAAWAAACRLDPAAAAKRCARATNERRVSVRPAPETMTYVTALLPVKDGVACYAALNAAANTAKASGDQRSRGQLMADVLVDRVTGRRPARTVGITHTAAVTQPAPVTRPAAVTQPAPVTRPAPITQPGTMTQPVAQPAETEVAFGAECAVEVHLIVTDQTLLAGGEDPALLTSVDPAGSNPASDLLPAPLARRLVRDAAKAWSRRLYCEPQSGQLVAMESTRRAFDGNLRRMLILRDRRCRTPWCDAPIRHGDHITPHADGGPTSLTNGQGLCERCNQTKNLPGWTARVVDPGSRSAARQVVRTTTPSGRSYDSVAPPLRPARLAG